MINTVKLLMAFAVTSLAIPTNIAMDKPAREDSIPTVTLLSQEVNDLGETPQWSHQFPLIGGGFISRISHKGIFVEIAEVHVGPNDHFKWLAGKIVDRRTPSKDVYVDMYMSQEKFSAALEDAGILMKHAHSF